MIQQKEKSTQKIGNGINASQSIYIFIDLVSVLAKWM